MSDEINFLIHSNAANAFRQGRITEQNRIIKLLQETRESRPCQCDECGDHVWGNAIDLIKGEQK